MLNSKNSNQVNNLQNLLKKVFLKKSIKSIKNIKLIQPNNLVNITKQNTLVAEKATQLIKISTSLKANKLTKIIKLQNFPQVIKKNKTYKNLFNTIKLNFYKFCQNAFFNNTFKFVYINYERYNYTLIEYICLYNKGEKFSVLDFCASVGIFIPHYCYHPDLSIAGNCRMCLVQLDGSIKPIASCAIIMSNKMIINTQSIFVKKAQEV